MKHFINSPKQKKGLHLSGMTSIVYKRVWEDRYYLKDTFEYLLQSEYVVYVRTLNAHYLLAVAGTE